jgi:hypothetical protein
VPVHEVGRDRGDDRRDHGRLELTVSEQRQRQRVEHRVVDDGVGAADDAELERLADEFVPPLRQDREKAHSATLRESGLGFVPTDG